MRPDEVTPGDQIGPYTIQSKLGSGGMGAVYLARHRHLDRAAAIKVLLPELSNNPDVVSRFFTEARATALIRHPGIVEVFDCDVLPSGRAYIVMEFLQGENLGSHLARARRLFPDMRTIAAITGMIADALEAAHGREIAHRDLKPDNVFLAHDPTGSGPFVVKILDFGIAKLLAERSPAQSSRTRTGSLLGTPIYMSPEQCRGSNQVDHRSDIYSLGCILFEMICGQPPFVREWPGDLLVAHVAEPAPAISSLEPGVPPEIDALVARMLAKDAADRPQTAGEIAAMMAQLLGLRRSQMGSAASYPEGFVLAGGTVMLPIPAVTPHPGQMPYSGQRTPAKTTPLPRNPTPTTFTMAASDHPLTSVSHRRRGLFLLLTVVGAVAAAAAIYAPWRDTPRSRVEVAPPVPVSRESAPRPPAEPLPPQQVTFTVQSEPADAQVIVAGQPVGRTPFSFALPRSSREVELVIRAAGFKETTRTLRADRDRDLELTLQREAPEPKSSVTRKTPRKAKPTPAQDDPPFGLVGD